MAITSFKVMNREVKLDWLIAQKEGIVLPYDLNFFSFEFAALDFTAPEKNQYAYMLEGVDADWIYSGSRRYAAYTSLNPGHYIFRIKGSNNNGLWNEAGILIPITISPHDHNKVYVGSQFVHQTTDGGESWQIISPDLSGNDPSLMGPSGGLTKDNIGVEMAQLVFAIAESPLEQGVIWAGTNDGFLHVTRDGGQSWTDVTDNVPELPPWGTVSNIHPSKHHAGTAYLSVDFHQMNGRDPYVYKTTDYGQSWRSIASDIPRSVFSYVHWVHEDPVRQGLLYLGTENAIYVSFNDGGNWLPLQNNLPHAPVHDVVVQEHFNDLVIATYGRGFWIMDDVTHGHSPTTP